MKATHTGFTLVELMITIFLVGILLGIGVPNFRDFIRNSRITTAANDLLADLNLARSEAVKRRVPVTLCKSANGSACDTSATTSFSRWIVFVDDVNAAATSSNDGNGIVNTGEQVLQDRSISGTIDAPAEGRLVVFQPSGFPAVGANTISRVLFCDDRGSAITVNSLSAARGLAVGATGRAAITRDKDRIDADVDDGGFGGCP
jgi:type IV fimbrial biogenesis protein FimT